MARPKHSDPGLFVASEVSAGTGIERRNLQLLRDRNAGPFRKADVRKLATDGLYTENTTAELAMVAGAVSAGLPLLAACEIIASSSLLFGNHVPARFCMSDDFGPTPDSLYEGWFRYHQTIARRSNRYSVGQAANRDAMLHVADRKLVLEGQKNPRLPLALPVVDDLPKTMPEPLCFIDMGADGGMRVVEHSDDINWSDDVAAADFRRRGRAAFWNARGVMSVNLSLAIRNAFDRTIDLRQAKGGPSWPEIARGR